MDVSFHVNSSLNMAYIYMNIEIAPQFFEQCCSVRLYENPSSGSRTGRRGEQPQHQLISCTSREERKINVTRIIDWKQRKRSEDTKQTVQGKRAQ
jgi:hypothetical protein